MTFRITAFTKYDRMAASTRQRILQFIPALNAAGIEVDYRPLLHGDYVESLGQGAHFPRHRIAAAYLNRLIEVGIQPLGDVIWVYAELFPRLPALFEKLLVARGRPIVYDLDDAFFHMYDELPNPIMRRIFSTKFEELLRNATACTCGNTYLKDYASQFCSNVVIAPTVVDTDIYQPAGRANSQPPIIGWIGSPSTWVYVKPLLPLLAQLVGDGLATVRVIGAGSASSDPNHNWIEFVDWSENHEVAELQRMDIGIMPLPDEPWTRGKCGYKLIQYLACGVPVVASPVGVNCEIVHDRINGFLASSVADWRMALVELLGNADLRRSMSKVGPSTIKAHFSLTSQAPRIVDLFRSVKEGLRPNQGLARIQ